MSIDQPTENWTKFPNCILDNLHEFDNEEFKILGLMVRKNLGYQNPNHEFSARYISSKTKISKPTVLKRLAKLLDRGSIQIIGIGKRGIHKYGINWSLPLSAGVVNQVDRSMPLTTTGQQALPLLVNQIDQVKENRVKDNTKRKAELVVRIWNKYNGSKITLTKTRESKINATLAEHSLREVLYSCVNLQNDEWYERSPEAKKDHHGIQRLIDPKKRDANLERFGHFPWGDNKAELQQDISREIAIEKKRRAESGGRKRWAS